MRTSERREVPKPGAEVEGVVTVPGERESMADTAAGPVRVQGGVPGDRALIRITHAGKNAVFGRIVRLLDPSPERAGFPCGNSECGACAWKNWSLKGQRREKTRRLREALSGSLGVEIEPMAAAPDAFGFRNKLLLVAGGRRGRLRLGLYSPRTGKLLDARRCPVQIEAGNRVAAGIAGILDSLRVGAWDGPRGAGLMRFVQIRVAPGTGDTQVTFVTGAPEWERGREAAERALCIEKVTTVSAAFNDSPSPVAAAETELLGGESRLLAAAGGARFLLSPFTFFQTNTAALPLLVQAVRDLLPRKRDRLADLYSGAGLFALTLADSAGSVIAVEADPAAAEDLTRSARLCGAENVEVRRADSAEALKSLPVPDAAVLDPPRSGLSEAFFAAVRGGFQPPAFVLVSCSTASLGKDVEAFAAAGYRAARARPVDMFPHTPHLETVTLLIRA